MYQMLIADDDQFVLDGLKEEIDWKKTIFMQWNAVQMENRHWKF